MRLGWNLYTRFLAGILECPDGWVPNFFTLTFPASRAPNEAEAHKALRSLVRRLRYRDLLGEFGWVLQRQKNGTLHYHGIGHMKWMDDDLGEWRRLIVVSGFGPQNKLVPAKASHAKYCAKYVARRLADVAKLKRAYSFSRSFPKHKSAKQVLEEMMAAAGFIDEEDPFAEECIWIPG